MLPQKEWEAGAPPGYLTFDEKNEFESAESIVSVGALGMLALKDVCDTLTCKVPTGG